MSGYPYGMEIGPGWEDALRAWRRLSKLLSSSSPGDHSGLDALADISVVRRQLEHVELAAVQAARRHGRSWAEIATSLGVTRQSAWERWRDLDDADRGVDEALLGVAEDLAGARGSKRGAMGRGAVPDVIGMTCGEATAVLAGAGFIPLAHNAGGDPVPLTTVRSGGKVVDQVPKGGSRRRAGSSVTVWYSDGGDAGVREPRRPSPPLRSDEASNDLPTPL